MATTKKRAMRKQPPVPRDKATRPDLVCERCSQTFEGVIDAKVCPACIEAEPGASPKDMPDTSPTVAEQEAARDGAAGKPYKKQVHVDPDRKRTEWTPPEQRERSAKAGLDTIAREDPKGQARRDPLREELERINAKIVSYEQEIAKLRKRKEEVLIDLQPKPDEMTKTCYGKGYDPRATECATLCPLAPECKAICAESPRVLMVGNARNV